MAHPGPAADGRRRRHRREAIVVAVVALLVVVAGLGAAGLYLGRLQLPARDTTASTPCVPAKRPALAPRQVKVNVYNATRRNGLAARTAEDLRERRFVIGAVSNDPARATVKGTALVRHGAKAAAAGRLVAAQVPGAKVKRVKRATRAVDLVLGAGFTSLAPAATAAATPAPVCPPSPPPRTDRPKPGSTTSR